MLFAISALASLASLASAANFSLITTHSGDTRLQYQQIGIVDGIKLGIHAAQPLTLELNPKGSAFVADGSGDVLTKAGDNSIFITSETTGSGPWSLGDGSTGVRPFKYLGNEPYVVCLDTGVIYIDQAPDSCSTVSGVDLLG